MMVTASATARAATGLAHRLALRNERRSLWAALEPSVSSHLGTLAISRTAAAPPPPCGARRWLAAASAPSTRRILKDGDATVVAVPPNLKIDPRSTCPPFYGLEKVTPAKKSRRINKRGEDGATSEAGGEAKTEVVEDVSEDELVDELVEDNDYDDEEEEDRILYDLTTRPEPYQAVPLPERLRVPVFALQTGEEVGSIHLSDKTFGCDPIRTDILHRVVIYQRNKKRGKRKAKTKTISEVSGSGRKVRQQKGSGMARAGHRRPSGGGGAGGGTGGGGGGRGEGDPNAPRMGGNNGGTHSDLIDLLYAIDNKQYPAYRDIESSSRGWENREIGYTLYVGRAQADPFARPTRCRVVVPASVAGFPDESYATKARAVALGDYVHRAFYSLCKSMGADRGAEGGGGWSGPKGGDVQIVSTTQHVLEQSAVSVGARGDVTAQFTVNLPARGRSILGMKAIEIFDQTVPNFVQKSLCFAALNAAKLKHHVLSVEDQEWLRSQLEASGLVAFVPDFAVLPRASGADDRPMADSSTQRVVRFDSPDSLRVSFALPNLAKTLTGMGVRRGITLVVGGGFHGKSTLLSALQVGVYNKVPGDGREFCVCDATAVKIRAEDGRAVSAVDISPFISNLPFGKGTQCFTTVDASGSTSQASNILESIEMGAHVFLVDEDTCATNFMIRDDKMMELVSKDKEPITPFVRKVRSLYEDRGISSILVIGGSGDYFDVADTVVMMDCYACHDVTERAKKIATAANTATESSSGAIHHNASSSQPFGTVAARCPVGGAFKPNNKVAVRAKSVVSYGDIELDLSGLEQIVSISQTNSIASSLQQMTTLASAGQATLAEILANLNAMLDRDGLNGLEPGQFNGGLARPRVFEIAGAANRLRSNGNMVQKR